MISAQLPQAVRVANVDSQKHEVQAGLTMMTGVCR